MNDKVQIEVLQMTYGPQNTPGLRPMVTEYHIGSFAFEGSSIDTASVGGAATNKELSVLILASFSDMVGESDGELLGGD